MVVDDEVGEEEAFLSSAGGMMNLEDDDDNDDDGAGLAWEADDACSFLKLSFCNKALAASDLLVESDDSTK